jgi:hypothetical protein
MQLRSETFFTLSSKAGPEVVAPHEQGAELAKRMHDTEHAGDDTT